MMTERMLAELEALEMRFAEALDGDGYEFGNPKLDYIENRTRTKARTASKEDLRVVQQLNRESRTGTAVVGGSITGGVGLGAAHAIKQRKYGKAALFALPAGLMAKGTIDAIRARNRVGKAVKDELKRRG